MNVNKRNGLFFIAYWEGHWVRVPLLDVPQTVPPDYELVYHDQSEFLVKQGCAQTYKRRASQAKETIIPERLSLAEVKKLCTSNGIPLEWVILCPNKTTPATSSKQRPSRRVKRKFKPLNRSEYDPFIENLRAVNPRNALIAELLCFLNGLLEEDDDFITIEELLRLCISDVDFGNDVVTGITLQRSGANQSHLLWCDLPGDLGDALHKEIRLDSLYVFSNTNGGPLLLHNINRSFKKASKKAGLKEAVTSLMLRPLLKSAPAKLKQFSAEEWETVCSHVPALQSKKGTSPIHDQRLICNAIFYHLYTATPWRKLPSSYPPGEVVRSQYRRWLKNGVLETVLAVRV